MTFKRHRYFAAGTEQFWQVSLDPGQLQFFHRDGHVVTVTGEELLEGEGIAAGMQISLAEIFRAQ